MGAINMLGLAKRVKARILQASTSEVYGDPQVHPQTEDYWGNVNPIGLRSCYDEGKRLAETLFMDYHRQNAVDTRIARIFNCYGPRMLENDGRVVSNFIVQAIQDKELTIYGDGSQTRSFCYVDDMIEGLVRLMNTEAEDIHLPVNLGNPEEFRIKDLAEEIGKLLNKEIKLKYLPLPPDDPKQRKPNIDRARKLLNWTPKIALSEGLKTTINYFSQKIRTGNTAKA
jgi:UDP-glucuronate decarboxylase